MTDPIRSAVSNIVTRVMREGGCRYAIKVSHVRHNLKGYSASVTVTRADGYTAYYRALVRNEGRVTVDPLPTA